MTNAPILTLTLNPALDITVTTDRLVPQRKLRCSAPRHDAGGGGANVSRVIHELGGDSLAFVVAGGPMGERYVELLRKEGLEVLVHAGEGETRFSLTVMEQATGLQYRFVLPGPEQSVPQAESILAAVRRAAADGSRIVVASGSLPPGLSIEFYGAIAAICREMGARLILDTSGPALAASLDDRPFCIRINHHEAGELLGGGPADVEGARELTKKLVRDGAAEIAIVTVGESGAIVAAKGAAFEVRPPPVQVVSAVGAGDSFVAALSLGMARGWPIEKSVRYGVAAAAAAVLTEATELCRREDVERFFAELGESAAVANHS